MPEITTEKRTSGGDATNFLCSGNENKFIIYSCGL